MVFANGGRVGAAPFAAKPAASDHVAQFEEAYRQYYTRVFGYIYNRVGNVELAKDLTAEVFEKAYSKARSLRDPEAYVAWLFTIAKNTVAGHFRKRKREVNGLHRVGQSMWLQDRVVDPADHLVRDEQVSRLLEQLRSLSDREQEVLALKFDGELTNREIGQVMAMSEVNVRVTLFRAITRLRERMKKEAGRGPPPPPA